VFRGVYPPTTMALFPPFARLPPFPPPLTSLPDPPQPANSFWTFYMQFCAILCVSSVNFGSWQSGTMTPKNEKYINGAVAWWAVRRYELSYRAASAKKLKTTDLKDTAEERIKMFQIIKRGWCSGPPMSALGPLLLSLGRFLRSHALDWFFSVRVRRS